MVHGEPTNSAARRVLVLADEIRGEVRHYVDGFVEWLGRRATVVGVDFTRDSDLSQAGADLLIAFGGDGTILGAARRTERALAGELVERPRMMLECRVIAPDRSAQEELALNDGVLVRESSASIIRVGVKVGGEFVTNYSGDGLIVATPAGSTAYSLGAGGPILTPGLEALVLTPLASHALTVRPLVIHASAGVELWLDRDWRDAAASFVVDGHVQFAVTSEHRISIRPATVRFRMLTDPRRSFFNILREKFGWAGSPKYG
jgi:NAD+ kinase